MLHKARAHDRWLKETGDSGICLANELEGDATSKEAEAPPFSTLRNEDAIGPAALTPIDKLATFGTSGPGCQVEGGVGCLSRKTVRSESNTNHTPAVWPWAMVSLSLSFPFGKQGWFRTDALSILVLGGVRSLDPAWRFSIVLMVRAEVVGGALSP